ncbi:unnamed protein product [Caenorhabditis auriculariae]|uniref:Uncharacterized protein n=1 Tax=Caenorhabditis auriculariae TaxID=2777116 RepID=A0A8S1GQE5_9PELO|nr:unnamed protein product [Caenorhabditis auriculariae]
MVLLNICQILVNVKLLNSGCSSQCVGCSGPQQQQSFQAPCCSNNPQFQQVQQSRTFTNGAQTGQMVMMYSGNGQQNSAVVSSYNAVNQGSPNYQNPGPIPAPGSQIYPQNDQTNQFGLTQAPFYNQGGATVGGGVSSNPTIGGGVSPIYNQNSGSVGGGVTASPNIGGGVNYNPPPYNTQGGAVIGGGVTSGPAVGGNVVPNQQGTSYTATYSQSYVGGPTPSPNYGSPNQQGFSSTATPLIPNEGVGYQPFVPTGNTAYNNAGGYNSANAGYDQGQSYQLPNQQFDGQGVPPGNQQIPPQNQNQQQGVIGSQQNGLRGSTTPFPQNNQQGASNIGQSNSQAPYPAEQYPAGTTSNGEPQSFQNEPSTPAYQDQTNNNPAFSTPPTVSQDKTGGSSVVSSNQGGPTGGPPSTTSSNFDPSLYLSTRNPNYPVPVVVGAGGSTPYPTQQSSNQNFPATESSPNNGQIITENQGASSTGGQQYQTTPYPQGFSSTQGPFGPTQQTQGGATPFQSTQSPSSNVPFNVNPTTQQPFNGQPTSQQPFNGQPTSQQPFNGQPTTQGFQQSTGFNTPPTTTMIPSGQNADGTFFNPQQQNQYDQGSTVPQAQYPSQQEIMAASGQNRSGGGNGVTPSTPQPQFPSQQEILAASGQPTSSLASGNTGAPATNFVTPQPQFPSQQDLLVAAGQNPNAQNSASFNLQTVGSTPQPRFPSQQELLTASGQTQAGQQFVGSSGNQAASGTIPPAQFPSQQELLAREQQVGSTVAPNGGVFLRPPSDNKVPGQPGYTPLYSDGNMNTQYGRYNNQSGAEPIQGAQFDQPRNDIEKSSARLTSILAAFLMAIIFF